MVRLALFLSLLNTMAEYPQTATSRGRDQTARTQERTVPCCQSYSPPSFQPASLSMAVIFARAPSEDWVYFFFFPPKRSPNSYGKTSVASVACERIKGDYAQHPRIH